MRTRRIGLMAAALMSATSLIPLAAPAMDTAIAPGTPGTFAFTTSYAEPYGAGYRSGTMTLRVTPKGLVNGTYRNDSGMPSFVTGGLTGDKIWLTVNIFGHDRITGTIKDGAIHGAGRHNSETWVFDAKPAPTT